MRTVGRRWAPALSLALVLCGCSSLEGEADVVADTSQVTEAPRPTSAGPTTQADPAPPDPAPPDPAPPDPAPPDPAPPDPAPPDPVPPAPDPAAVDGAGAQGTAQQAASVTGSVMAAACDDVVAAMTEAVMTYETQALAEGGGGGNRTAAAAEMRTAWNEARAAAERVGAGLPSAAAPAMASLTALHDGLGTRQVLDESDADPWREEREALQRWCRAQG